MESEGGGQPDNQERKKGKKKKATSQSQVQRGKMKTPVTARDKKTRRVLFTAGGATLGVLIGASAIGQLTKRLGPIFPVDHTDNTQTKVVGERAATAMAVQLQKTEVAMHSSGRVTTYEPLPERGYTVELGEKVRQATFLVDVNKGHGIQRCTGWCAEVYTNKNGEKRMVVVMNEHSLAYPDPDNPLDQKIANVHLYRPYIDNTSYPVAAGSPSYYFDRSDKPVTTNGETKNDIGVIDFLVPPGMHIEPMEWADNYDLSRVDMALTTGYPLEFINYDRQTNTDYPITSSDRGKITHYVSQEFDYWRIETWAAQWGSSGSSIVVPFDGQPLVIGMVSGGGITEDGRSISAWQPFTNLGEYIDKVKKDAAQRP